MGRIEGGGECEQGWNRVGGGGGAIGVYEGEN